MIKQVILSIALTTLMLTASPQWVKVNVIVASKSGLSHDTELRYAYNDAKKMRSTLAELSDVDPKNNFLITTESTTDLREKLSYISERITKLKQKHKVLLQFYYSGHGSGSSFHIGNEKFLFKEVKSLLNTTQIDTRIFILDVCFGGTFLNSKGFTKAKPISINLDVNDATQGEVIISSSAVNEQAYEIESLEGSVFSTNWIMGLRGAGDKNGDGQVSLFEAYNHAYDHTVNYTSQTLQKPQHPSYNMDLTGAHDIVLTKPTLSANGIVFDNCPKGIYTIYNASHYHTIGDVRISDSGQFFLALQRGSYSITTPNSDGRIMEASISVTTNLTEVTYSEFSPKKESAIIHKRKGSRLSAFKPDFATRLVTNSGVTLYKGFGYHSLSGITQSLNAQNDIEDLFDINPSYVPDETIYDNFGINLVLSTGNWGIAGHIEGYNQKVSMQGKGTEPTQEPQEDLDVFASGSVELFHIEIGIAFQKRIFLEQAHRIDGELGASFVGESYDHAWSYERKAMLFSKEKYDYRASMSGSRYHIAARYRYHLETALNLAIGAKLSAYLLDLKTNNIPTGENATVFHKLNGHSFVPGIKLDLLFFIGPRRI
ncbi:MAG: caspase family protein [Fibrobacterales bacterium]